MTARGVVRTENQDRCLIGRSGTSGITLIAVCDGIGGMANGASAAEIAVCRFAESFFVSREVDLPVRLSNAAGVANAAVYSEFRESGGTTLAAVARRSKHGTFAVTVGDTRVYTFTGKSQLQQISFDDTIAGELQRLKGTDLPEELLDPATRHLAQYVGMGAGLQPRSYGPIELDENGCILVSTDGVHSMPSKALERIATHAPTLSKLGQRLIQAAEWMGGNDNATVVILPQQDSNPAVIADEYPGFEFWIPFAKIQVIGANVQAETNSHLAAIRPTDTPPNVRRTETPHKKASQKSERPSRQGAARGKQNRSLRSRDGHAEQPQIGIELIETASSLPPDTTPGPSDPGDNELRPEGSDHDRPYPAEPADESLVEKTADVPSVPEQSESK